MKANRIQLLFPPHLIMASMIAPQMALRAFRTAPKAVPWAKLSTQLPRAQPAFRRFFTAVPQEQPRLRLGSTGMFEIRSQLPLNTGWV